MGRVTLRFINLGHTAFQSSSHVAGSDLVGWCGGRRLIVRRIVGRVRSTFGDGSGLIGQQRTRRTVLTQSKDDTLSFCVGCRALPRRC